MKKIYFATTNEGKLKEAKAILGIEIEGVGLESVFEMQTLDPVTLTEHKAEQYFEYYKRPIIVEDTFLFIDDMKGLPGPYYKDFLKTIGNEGILKFMQGERNRGAKAQSTLVFKDQKGKPHVFIGEVKGKITNKIKGEGFGWDPIFVPNGHSKTFGEMEMEEKNKLSMRAKAFKKFKVWLDKQK